MTTEASAPRPGHPARRTYALSGALAVSAGLLLAGPLAGVSGMDHTSRLAWPALAVMFLLAEILVVHVPFRRETYSLALGEVPLVAGLILVSPLVLVGCRLAGSGVSLVAHRRQPAQKVAFNLATFAFEACVAEIAWRAVIGGHQLYGPWGWLAAIVAVSAAEVVNALTVSAVSSLHSGAFQASMLSRALGFGSVAAVTNTSLVLTGLVLIHDEGILGVWPLLVIGTVVLLAYRAYNSLRARYGRLELLYAFTSRLSRYEASDDLLLAVLSESQVTMQADTAGFTVFDDAGAGSTCLVGEETGGILQRLTSAPGGAGLERQAVANDDPVVLTKAQGRHDPVLLCSGVPVADAIAVGLQGPKGRIGVLFVAGRLGDQTSFDGEDARLFGALAAHVSVALEKDSLIERLREQAADKEYQALHDDLTGLANRTLFHQAVGRSIADCEDARRSGEELAVAVMLIDLDRFKEVNDTLGHHNGDRVLRRVAARLSAAVGGAHLSRLGGDEFAVCLPNLTGPDEALEQAERLRRTLEKPLPLGPMMIDVSASIGVSLYPSDGDNSSTLLQRADVAMYSAKQSRAGSALYTTALDRYNPRRLSLAGELRSAVERDQLTVYFQPVADLTSGTIISAEALVRWQHPRYGLLPPDEFIPMAEQTGAIQGLTMVVLRSSLRQLKAWRDAGFDLQVAVNLSVRLLTDATLPAAIGRLLEDAGLPGDALEIEITESMMMVDPERTAMILGELADMGIGVAIDDFGTGYSSLSYLRRLPVRAVKIDKSFVLRVVDNDNDLVIVRSIIDLASNLGLHTIAEGVEDAATWDLLSRLGCDRIQGYTLSRPQPGAVITANLEKCGVSTPKWRAATAILDGAVAPVMQSV